jgi:drug/metabolite transporter (DMT)-like permease
MRKWLARVALVLLVLAAELTGRSLTHRIDVGRHVATPSYHDAAYYPFLLAAVKIGIALMLARIAWRFFGARRIASVLAASPRLRLELSWRLWLASFLGTAGVYLVQVNPERALLHTSAIPVFAVLAVFVAVLYRTAERFLGEYERIAAHAVDLLRRVAAHRPPLARPRATDALSPRRRFGVAFESRPPPQPAV